jgi:hypothetical protein
MKFQKELEEGLPSVILRGRPYKSRTNNRNGEVKTSHSIMLAEITFGDPRREAVQIQNKQQKRRS